VHDLTRLQFIASRPSTPLLFKGKHGPTLSRELDSDGAPSPRSPPKENGGLNVPKPNSAPKSGPDAVSVLEAKANGL
jgi:2-isopropylmalate synthase